MKVANFSKPLKLLIGFIAIWPFIYLPLFMISIFSTIAMSSETESFPTALVWIFPIHFLTIIASLVVMGLCIYDVFTNDRIKGDKKALWGVVLLLGGMLALPFYWYIYIWKAPLPASRSKKRRS